MLINGVDSRLNLYHRWHLTVKYMPEHYYLLSQDSQEKYFLDLLSDITIPPGKICLDIGCGTGNFTSILTAFVGEEGYVCGIDPDVNRIAVATENQKNYY